MEGFYFHCSLSVCVSVCLCVCPTLLVNKIPGCTDLDAVSTIWLARILLKLVTLGQRSRSQWHNIHFFHNSLLTSQRCISALSCSIKLKFSMSPRYTLNRFVFKFFGIGRWCKEFTLWTQKRENLKVYATPV